MKRIPDEDRAGLYLTVIIHLAVLIFLLASGLGYSLSRENSFVLDYSKQEEIEKMQQEIAKLQEEAAFKEGVSQRLQQILEENGVNSRESEVKNVAVNRGALKDDRGTDAEQLYKDAERLQNELKGGYEIPDEDHAALDSPAPDKNNSGKKSEPKQNYTGPSVIAYELEGRKASKLPIPAYRCMGAGQVKVLISVNTKGDVVGAKIDESCSSTDSCLRSFAIRAARLSKFAINTSAPAKQSGYIIYEFIAQ